LLLEKGYEVHGIVRRSSTTTRERIEHLHMPAEVGHLPLALHYGDICDLTSLTRIIEEVRPEEIYNLAAQSHVRVSFDMPEYTLEVTGMGAFRMLEAVRRAAPNAHFYQAGSSEMFGKVAVVPQNEATPFHPRSPYAIAKVFAHYTAIHYREAHGLFVSNGILFNHESPRRGENFLTRKVAIAAARIYRGLQKDVSLGNLDAKRDWGYAPEYVEAMWLMLQQDEPDDFVIGTGETHPVSDFVSAAFDAVGLRGEDHIAHDEQFERPTEVDILQADPSKALRRMGWKSKTTFNDLVKIMVDAEVARLG